MKKIAEKDIQKFIKIKNKEKQNLVLYNNQCYKKAIFKIKIDL